MCTQVPAAGPDPSVKAGQMTSQVAAALAAARNADRSQRGAAHYQQYHAAAGDASVRFGQAHFAQTQEGFARHFGPYAGRSRDPWSTLMLTQSRILMSSYALLCAAELPSTL